MICSSEDARRNEREIGVDLSLFAVGTLGLEKFVPGPEMALGGQNQITERGLFASHPRTAGAGTYKPSPLKTASPVASPPFATQPPWTPLATPFEPEQCDCSRTLQSTRTTVATFTAYRYPRFYLGLSVRRYRQVQTRPESSSYTTGVYLYIDVNKLVYRYTGFCLCVPVHTYPSYSCPARIQEPVEIHFKFNGDFAGLIRLLSDFAHQGKL